MLKANVINLEMLKANFIEMNMDLRLQGSLRESLQLRASFWLPNQITKEKRVHAQLKETTFSFIATSYGAILIRSQRPKGFVILQVRRLRGDQT